MFDYWYLRPLWASVRQDIRWMTALFGHENDSGIRECVLLLDEQILSQGRQVNFQEVPSCLLEDRVWLVNGLLEAWEKLGRSNPALEVCARP